MKNKINTLFIFFYLALFPFGQLPNLSLSLWQQKAMSIQPTDILLGLLLVLNFRNVLKVQFVWILVFSLFFSLIYFSVSEIAVGFLYFLRFVSYINLGIVVFNNDNLRKMNLLTILLSVVCVIALFGWIQYLFIPDLRTLSILGWDDHYFRLAGTFLDPAFTGILLVLGFILSVCEYKTTRSNIFLIVSMLLLLTLGFTYSRASYLAALTGIIFLVHKWISKKLLVLGFLILALLVTQLPRPEGGEGVKLERLYSLELKIKNSLQGVSYISASPLFGYGYNNSCALQKTIGSSTFIKSNSCSGFDNSIIYILVTTGALGFVTACVAYRELLLGVHEKYKILLYALSASIFIHGMFTNTFVYPWVLGFMAIMFGVTVKKN